MSDRRPTHTALPVLVALAVALLASCSATGDGNGTVEPVTIPAASMSTIVLAWSEVGMHEVSPTYDREVLFPPYSTIRAQVIRRGDPPEIVTTGIILEYSIVGNTYSYGKSTPPTEEDPLRLYAGFWDNSLDLFGVDLAPDTGLNFVDPGVHNGLSGTMVLRDDHFEAVGVPVVPIDDAGAWEPYQVAEIVVRDSSTLAELARTRATVPVSDEISCNKCHGSSVGTSAVLSVLEEHDENNGTSFAIDGLPVLCADCHGSPALGQTGPGSSELYLSEVIHGFHATTSAACYDCHPGTETLGHRSLAHTSGDGACTGCHGALATIAVTIGNGRVPWVNEPKCADCHTFVAEVDTGSTLYRDGAGHGGLSCAACHGSPHAQVPSREESDNKPFTEYQGKALALGSCRVCHPTARGGGLMGIVQAHGGMPGAFEPTSCTVCHTGPITTTNPVNFPHRFQQRNR
jgi:hypothetical protein